MTDLDKALAAAREALDTHRVNTSDYCVSVRYIEWAEVVERLIAALDAAQGRREYIVAEVQNQIPTIDHYTASRIVAMTIAMSAVPPAALAVPADNVTPMRQPRADLARLVESINAAVYANGNGLSVTEAIGALELAKLELFKEQEQ